MTLALPNIRSSGNRARVMAVANQKGGTGKTTGTVNLGAFFSNILGYKVLLVDTDSAGSLSKTFLGPEQQVPISLADLMDQALDPNYNSDTPLPTATAIVNVRPNLDLLPSTKRLARLETEIAQQSAQWILKAILDPIRPDYDLIIIDTVPSLNPTHIAAMQAAEDVLITLGPTSYDEWGIPDLVASIKRVKKGSNPQLEIIGVILNRTPVNKDGDISTTEGRQIEDDLKQTGLRLIGKIRRAESIAKAPGRNQTIFEHDPDSKAANDYCDVGSRLMKLWVRRPTGVTEAIHA